MLYSAEKGNNTSFRGRVWQLTNKQWRACNYNGQQCSFKLYNEALRFSVKGKPVNEDVDETYDDEHRTGKYVTEARSRTYYKPELKGSEMRKLAAGLISQGYKADVKGPNLSTDAPEAVVDAVHGYATSEGMEGTNEGPRQPGRRVPQGKAPKSMPDRSAFDAIKPGSRVTIKTPQGQTRRGKAVMYNSKIDGWVLNMGGRHGTPGIVTRDNFVALGGGGGAMNRLSDRPRKNETNRINEGKRVTTKRDLTYKKANVVVPKGTAVELEFREGQPDRAYFEYEGTKLVTRLEVAHSSFSGIAKPPTIGRLQKLSDDGLSITPTGKRVEPDGYGPDGSPSWLLVMGLI